jgi:transposase
MKILALDLGKFKSVSCLQIDDQTPSYGKVSTDRQSIHDLLVEHQPDRLVIEIGSSSGWVHDLAVALGLVVQVVNANDERWHWKRVKEKSDRKDALKMVQMSRLESLPLMPMPNGKTRQWRSLIRYRATLVDRRTAVKNSIRAIFQMQGLPLPSADKAWSVVGLKDITRHASDQPEDDQLWQLQLHAELACLTSLEQQIEQITARLNAQGKSDARVQRLQTAPCVGPRLSEMVVAALDDPHRFKNARQVGCYAGLTPRRWQSGSTDRQGHISRAGNPLLRELLVQIAWIGVKNNTWMKQVYENVRRGSDQRKKIAIVAVARRLLVKLWAMLRDGTDWKDPDQAHTMTAALAAGS